MTLLLDTSSDWMWIQNQHCKKSLCSQNKYINTLVPQTHQNRENYIQINYRQGYVKGLPVNDSVHMRSFDGLKTATINDFNFLGKGTT